MKWLIFLKNKEVNFTCNMERFVEYILLAKIFKLRNNTCSHAGAENSTNII
jgi:hypothetical protein